MYTITTRPKFTRGKEVKTYFRKSDLIPPPHVPGRNRETRNWTREAYVYIIYFMLDIESNPFPRPLISVVVCDEHKREISVWNCFFRQIIGWAKAGVWKSCKHGWWPSSWLFSVSVMECKQHTAKLSIDFGETIFTVSRPISLVLILLVRTKVSGCWCHGTCLLSVLTGINVRGGNEWKTWNRDCFFYMSWLKILMLDFPLSFGRSKAQGWSELRLWCCLWENFYFYAPLDVNFIKNLANISISVSNREFSNVFRSQIDGSLSILSSTVWIKLNIYSFGRFFISTILFTDRSLKN
jgi:hypothetical protein